MTVLAGNRKLITNAQLILNLVELGYIKPTDEVVDVTYGKGKWWRLYKHDHDRFLGLIWKGDYKEGSDFRDPVALIDDFGDLPFPNAFANVVCFDPPYVSPGGRTTSTIPDFNDRYGLRLAAKTPLDLHLDNMRGLLEAERICKPGGFLLMKTKSYVSSGKLQAQVHWAYDAATATGLRLVDEFYHVSPPGPQPEGRGQVHARQNVSRLLVFRKPQRAGFGQPLAFLRWAIGVDTDRCIEWPYAAGPSGYGVVQYGEHSRNAHAVVCELTIGPAPSKNHVAAHEPLKCHNRRCVNKRHVRWATRSENEADKVLDGTVQRGSRNSQARLGEAEVREIKRLLATGASIATLAERFGVGKTTISAIRTGRNWSWLS